MSIPQKSIFHNDETTADKGLMRLTPLEQSSAGFGILVVEDQRLLRKSLGLALRDRGFETWLASDGFEALDLIRQHKSQIDVVLSDVRMPLMNGFEMLNVLRSVYCDVQCCFMTCDDSPATLEELANAGAARVFMKPFPSIMRIVEELWLLAALRRSSR